MFERFTEQARRVLFFARYEASMLGSVSIETEHLLLGLIREGKGLTGRIFARSHVSLEHIRQEIEGRIVFREKVSTAVEIPFSSETRRILNHAAEEADRLLHNYIGAEHLLLGILREEQSLAATILEEKGMRLNQVREDIVVLLNESPELRPDEVSAPPAPRDSYRIERRLIPEVHDHRISGSTSFLEIRIGPGSKSGSHSTSQPGSWRVTSDLRSMLSTVSGVPMSRVELPSWLDKGETFDFSMLYSPDLPNHVRDPLMLAWIESHFKVSIVRESRTMDVYVLGAPAGLNPSVKEVASEGGWIGGLSMNMEVSPAVTGDGAPALDFSTHPPGPGTFRNASIGSISASGATCEELAEILEQALDRFVVDETNLTGRYEFQLTGESGTTEALFDRLRDQLGLTLAPASRSVTMLVAREVT